MPENTTAARAVFLSYARDDAEPVRRIADALRAFGVEVWFDQNELRGGDAWDTKIRTQIRTCALCVPVISATTQARGEGYFRREWRFAVERTHDMAAGVPFLLPVVIDDTKESDALVPEEFMKVQWTRLPMGVPTSQFVEQVKKLLDAPGKRVEAGRSRPTVTGRASREPVESGEAGPGSTTPATKRGIPGWTWGALTAVAVGVVVALGVFRKAEPVAVPPPVDTKPATPAEPAARVMDKSIAVLPFTNMSEDKEGNAFFSDGIHEDILTNLALIRELRVVSRTSVLSYRNTTESMKQIAQQLGVTYILEGSVRRSGNKVRVTGQLIHAASDEHVWAQSYDRDITDVFAIQAELSSQIAGALKAALSPEEKVLIARRPTENPAAYDLFLRARDVTNRENIVLASRRKQLELLESAVALDPNFAQAWAELASSSAFWYFNSFPDMDARLARAKVAMDRAMQLAPDDPEVFGNLGTYYYYGFRDYARATEQYERRARLQPNSPVVFNSLALIQRRQGNWTQSLANSRRACELDPANFSYQRNLIASLQACRRWDELKAARRRLATLSPDDIGEAYELAMVSFRATGSRREVEEFFSGLPPAELNSPRGLQLRQDFARYTGNFVEAVRIDGLQPYFEEDGTPEWLQTADAALDRFALRDTEGMRNRLGGVPEQLRQLVQQEPKNVQYQMYLGQIEAILGNGVAARRRADRIVEILPETADALSGATGAALRAILYDISGDKETALAEYARLLRKPTSGYLLVHEMKALVSTLHGDPRFEALLNDPANNAPLF